MAFKSGNWQGPFRIPVPVSVMDKGIDSLKRAATHADYVDAAPVEEKPEKRLSNYQAYIQEGKRQRAREHAEYMAQVDETIAGMEKNRQTDAYIKYARGRGLSEQHIQAVLDARDDRGATWW